MQYIEGIQQGIHQGLLEGIEPALSVKFGARGMKLVPTIRRVRDPDRLEAIMEAIKVSKRLSELEEVVTGQVAERHHSASPTPSRAVAEIRRTVFGSWSTS